MKLQIDTVDYVWENVIPLMPEAIIDMVLGNFSWGHTSLLEN